MAGRELLFYTRTGFYPLSQDAPARILTDIINQLLKRGYNIKLFACFKGGIPGGKCVFTSKLEKIRTWRLKDVFLVRQIQRFFIVLKICLYFNKGAVLVFNTPPVGIDSFLVLLSKLVGQKNVCIIHGGFFTEQEHHFASKVKRCNLKTVSPFIDKVVVVSDAFRKAIESCFPGSSIKVIHNGIVPSRVTETKKVSNIFKILYLGRIEKIKGLDVLVDAFSMFLKKHRSTTLHIAGEGSYEPVMREKVQSSGLSDAVKWLGFLSDDQIKEQFREADVMVLPTVGFEPFGLVILEAMANGVPVIASRTGGVPEIIEDGVNGLLFKPGDSTQLFNSIEKIYSDNALRTELVKNALNSIREKFSWDIISQQYDELFKGL